MWSHACLFHHEFSTAKNNFETASNVHFNEPCIIIDASLSRFRQYVHCWDSSLHSHMTFYSDFATWPLKDWLSYIVKGTTNWRTVEEINRVTQHDEAALLLWCSLETVYLNISYGMDWNDTPSSNETTQLSVKRIWTMTLTAGLQRLVET